jgi:SPP1 family predicted phage head-tail adaptor
VAYLNAQKLNRRITIQQRTDSQDTAGQPLLVWTDVCTVWAHVKFQSGMGFVSQEMFVGGNEVSRPVASIRIRWRDGIEPGMRVVDTAGRLFDIRVVLPDAQDHRYLDLGCATGASDG